MELVFAILFVLYLLFFIPAFMFTWEGSVFDGIGCYGWVCMIVGFPGAVIAVIAKLIMNSYRSKQIGEYQIRESIYDEQLKIKNEQLRIKEEENRSKIRILEDNYRHGELVYEVYQRIVQNTNEQPYKIEIKINCIIIYFENRTENFILATHGFRDFKFNDDDSIFAFANILNNMLGSKYTNSSNSKYHSFTHPDGSLDGWTEYLGRKLILPGNKDF